MEERKALLEELARGEASVAELCRRYGVSRKTAYKWKQRLAEEGAAGLADRNRAPHRQARELAAGERAAIVAIRRQHATWGPRKIRDYLRNQDEQAHLPAKSTIGELLLREGLVARRRRRRRVPALPGPLTPAATSNQVWTADFKGWFRVRDGTRCDPLTIQDSATRYLLRVRHLARTDTAHAAAVCTAVFREYGLPEVIRTDNGPPFASPAPAGLSRLAMFWIRLGIRPERIPPASPQSNGRHERLHLTLLQDTAAPPAANLHRQQQRFAAFEHCYNRERPHEALDGRTPASLYTPSPRPWPGRLAEVVYPDGYLVRRVAPHGDLKLHGARIFLSEVLAGEPVGLRAVDDALFEVYWAHVLLGWLDDRSHCFVTVQREARR